VPPHVAVSRAAASRGGAGRCFWCRRTCRCDFDPSLHLHICVSASELHSLAIAFVRIFHNSRSFGMTIYRATAGTPFLPGRREILIVLVARRISIYRLIANATSAVRLLIASLS
jgi:hypothetical protein